MALYGFYSPTAAKTNGSYIYKLTDGSEVEVTALCTDKEGSAYRYEDKVYVGEVTKYIRFVPSLHSQSLFQ